MSDAPAEWGKYSAAGIQMVLIMLLCWWIGSKIGEYFSFEPWGSILGIFFGIFAGMYNLIKSVK